jgi:uncharacterized protein
MRLHLDRDRDEPLPWEETVVLDPSTLGQDLLVELGPIAVRGRVDKISDDGDGETGRSAPARSRHGAAGSPGMFQLGMDLSYRQGLACTRCLQPVRSDVETRADLTVATRARPGRGRQPEPEVELGRNELGILVIDGEHLDTEPLIAEQILLEVPMKPLCAPDCRGLCPRCGADRNQTPDCCEEPAGDERWEALAALRDRLPADRH